MMWESCKGAFKVRSSNFNTEIAVKTVGTGLIKIFLKYFICENEKMFEDEECLYHQGNIIQLLDSESDVLIMSIN